jgi:hypothetical protein
VTGGGDDEGGVDGVGVHAGLVWGGVSDRL